MTPAHASDTAAALRSRLAVLRRRKGLILLGVVLVPLVALLVSLSQEKLYEASSGVLVNKRNVSSRISLEPTGVSDETDSERFAATEVGLTRSPEVARRVVKAAKIPGLTPGAFHARSGSGVETGTNLLQLSATDPDALRAQRLSVHYARQYIAYRRQLDTAAVRRARSDLRRRIREVRRRDGRRSALYRTLVNREQQLQTTEALQTGTLYLFRPATGAQLVQPRTARNLTFALLVGCLLGLGLAFLREGLDTRLRNTEEIASELELPILGQISDNVFGRSPASVNGNKVLSDDDVEALHILRANLDFLDVDSPVRSLAVTSALPEEGKSTVAAALAGAYSRIGRTVLLVDGDLRRPSLAKRLYLSPAPGLSEHLTGRADLADITQWVHLPGPEGSSANGAGEHSPGRFACVTAGDPPPHATEVLRSRRFQDFLSLATSTYDLVIIDTPPLLSVAETRELLPHIDGILLCVRASRTTRQQAGGAKAALDRLPPRPTGLVITGLKPRQLREYGYYTYGPAERG